MPNLQRAEDQEGSFGADPDQVSPAIIGATDDDRRTAPAAERLFALLAQPWDVQIRALELASVELATVVRQSRRLQGLRTKMLRSRRTQQLAEQDLDHLKQQRNLHVARQAPDDGSGGRKKRRKTEEAREEAGRVYDARVATTKRITVGRLQTATNELAELRAEEADLTQSPLIVDPSLLAWVEDTAASIEATLERDRDARMRTLEPWTRLRLVDNRIVNNLREAVRGDVLPGQAYGEGPLHLVVGSRLALVELRHGRDGTIALEEGEDDIDRLWQVRPQGDIPLGLTDGTVVPLHAARDAVEAAIGRRPAVIVCVSGWTRAPDQLEDIHLCGPASVADVVLSLEEAPVSRDELRQAARALAALPLPDVGEIGVSSLDHVATIHVEDVPEGLPATRDLVLFAHERRYAEA